MKNLLKAVILASTVGLTNCTPFIYEYNGKIGDELVRSCDLTALNEFILEITKKDGRVITYYDKCRDKILDSVMILKDKETKTYKKDKIGEEALKIAQQQYTDYLTKILEIKRKRAVEEIQ
jgi:hypothetical protein